MPVNVLDYFFVIFCFVLSPVVSVKVDFWACLCIMVLGGNRVMGKGYKILQGKIPVLISAPHCETHLRNSVEKSAERKTKDIALYLYAKTGCHVIYKVYDTTNNIDPNFHDCDYKEDMIKHIKETNIQYLIDLHQMAPHKNGVSRKDICIGTGGNNHKNIFLDTALLQLICDIFEVHSIDTIVNGYNFRASMPYTISSTVSRRCGIKCFQLEINSGFLKKRFGQGLRKTNKALKEIIRELS